MLGTGKSFRTARDADTIRQGFTRAVLYGEAAMRAGSVDLTCTIERGGRGTQKTYTVNGSAGALCELPRTDTRRAVRAHRSAARRRTAGNAARFPQRRTFAKRARLLPRARALSKGAPAKERAPARYGSSRRRASRGLRRDADRRRHAHHRVARALRRGAGASVPHARTRGLRRPNNSTSRTIPTSSQSRRRPKPSRRHSPNAYAASPRPSACVRARSRGRIATTSRSASTASRWRHTVRRDSSERRCSPSRLPNTTS